MEKRTAEILCIGTEILMGDIVNTNAAVIAKELAALGINLYHQTVVGDNPARLADALALAFGRADIVITTGGLGPTYDDLSKETIAAYFGLGMELHQPSLEALESFFVRRGSVMTENNRKQAMMPQGATVLPNPNGTAPGCAIEKDGKTAILMPGPPREMEPMLKQQVVPFLRKGSTTRLVSRNLHFFGIGESTLENMLHDLMTGSTNPTVAPYAKTGEVMLRVTASVEQGQDPEGLLQPAVDTILAAAGQYLYGIDVGDLQTAVVRLLAEKGLHAATAESCTGGLLAQRMTQVSGASQVFEWGAVTYSDRMKIQQLGVAPETIRQFGAVSEETAREMAAGARRLSSAEIGVAVTGNAGPLASEGKEVGLVYVAVDSERLTEVLTLHMRRNDQDAREYIRHYASSHALNLLRRAAEMY